MATLEVLRGNGWTGKAAPQPLLTSHKNLWTILPSLRKLRGMNDDLDEDDGPGLPALCARGDPAALGWPPTLPLEIALREHPVVDICVSYGVDKARWDQLRADRGFQAAVVKYAEQLKTEGMGFKLKAQLQSEALLQKSWKIIHDPDTPANVKADLIKSTWKAAGHGGADGVGGQTNAFQIQINL